MRRHKDLCVYGLLTKLVPLSSLDIGQVLFLRVYGEIFLAGHGG